MSTLPPCGARPCEPDRRARPARGRRILWLVRAAAGVSLLASLAWLARPPGAPPPATLAPASAALDRAPARPPPDRGREPDPARPVHWTGRSIYRWWDADGGLHLTSEPPPPGVRAEAVPLQAEPAAPDGVSLAATVTTLPDPLSNPLSVYTPQGLRALGERLAETRRRLEERERVLEALRLEAGR